MTNPIEERLEKMAQEIAVPLIADFKDRKKFYFSKLQEARELGKVEGLDEAQAIAHTRLASTQGQIDLIEEIGRRIAARAKSLREGEK